MYLLYLYFNLYCLVNIDNIATILATVTDNTIGK